jgi:heme A synthase
MVGLLVFLLAVYMASFDGVRTAPSFSLSGRAVLFFGVGGLVFLLATLGAYVRHADAGLACTDWPTCFGGLFPKVLTGHVLIHFSHRVLAALVVLTIVALYAAVASTGGSKSRALPGPSVSGVGQIVIGGGCAVEAVLPGDGAAPVVALGMLTVLFHLWAQGISGGTARPLTLPGKPVRRRVATPAICWHPPF